MGTHPVKEAESAGRGTAQGAGEVPCRIADQVGANMGQGRLTFAPHRCLGGEGNGLASDLDLGRTAAARQPFDGAAILVAGLEVHPGVDPGRIRAQSPLDVAEVLEHLAPVDQSQLAQAGEGVADGDLVLRLAGLLAQAELPEGAMVGAFEPGLDGRQRFLFVVQMANQLRGEVRTRGGMSLGEFGHHAKQLVGIAPADGHQAIGPEIRLFGLAQIAERPGGQLGDALDQGYA